MAPRVLVDAAAVPADRGALGRYTDGLIAALGGVGTDLVVACQRSDAERYSRMAPQARVVSGPVAIAHRPARLAWEQTGLPLLAQQEGVDVIHAPQGSMPVRPGKPIVVTIHDATYFSEPELHSRAAGNFYRTAIRTAVHRATRIIVPSKATRDELVHYLDADPVRIDVAHHGVDQDRFHRPSEAEQARIAARLGLRGRSYIAFLGALERRKNVPALIRGYVEAATDLPGPPALVLAGSSGQDEQVDAALAEVPSHLRVVRPGFLHVGDLPGYLASALVAAFPSQREGFGLPVLEAMACGAAVLTTHRTSLPEVGGDAVAYTEPDAHSIATALRGLIQDEGRRRALGAAAHTRAREFTWNASVEAHLASYARALEN